MPNDHINVLKLGPKFSLTPKSDLTKLKGDKEFKHKFETKRKFMTYNTDDYLAKQKKKKTNKFSSDKRNKDLELHLEKL